MFLLYADEFGHDGIWDPLDPRHNHHPLFGLAGFVIPVQKWRDLDRGYLQIKRNFYAHEIIREEAKGTRPERYEAKELSDRRDIRFTNAAISLLHSLGAHTFIQGNKKPIGGPHHSDALYGSITQRLMDSFETYMRNRASKKSKGMIVLDRRAEQRDVQLLFSAQSYLFSAKNLPGSFERLIETPLLVRSEWHHGIQAADTLARAIGKIYRYRLCGEQAYKKFQDKLGTQLDTLTYHIPNQHWSSVTILA
jgi:Protein of unknown function (DUF3800)